MDDVTRSLIAVGASAAVNCRPCLQFHLAAARSVEADAASIAEALEVGLRVAEGANRKTREYIEELSIGADLAQDEVCAAAAPGEVAACSIMDR